MGRWKPRMADTGFKKEVKLTDLGLGLNLNWGEKGGVRAPRPNCKSSTGLRLHQKE